MVIHLGNVQKKMILCQQLIFVQKVAKNVPVMSISKRYQILSKKTLHGYAKLILKYWRVLFTIYCPTMIIMITDLTLKLFHMVQYLNTNNGLLKRHSFTTI